MSTSGNGSEAGRAAGGALAEGREPPAATRAETGQARALDSIDGDIDGEPGLDVHWFTPIARAINGGSRRVQIYREQPARAAGYCGMVSLEGADAGFLMTCIQREYGGGRYRLRPLDINGNFAKGSSTINVSGPPRVDPQNWEPQPTTTSGAPMVFMMPDGRPVYAYPAPQGMPYMWPQNGGPQMQAPQPNPDIVSSLGNMLNRAIDVNGKSRDPQLAAELAELKTRLEISQQMAKMPASGNDPFAELEGMTARLATIKKFAEAMGYRRPDDDDDDGKSNKDNAAFAGMFGQAAGVGGLPPMPRNADEAMYSFIGMMLFKNMHEPQIIQTPQGPMQAVRWGTSSFLAPLGWTPPPGMMPPAQGGADPSTLGSVFGQPPARASARPASSTPAPSSSTPAPSSSTPDDAEPDDAEADDAEAEEPYNPDELADFFVELHADHGPEGLAGYIAMAMAKLPPNIKAELQRVAEQHGVVAGGGQ